MSWDDTVRFSKLIIKSIFMITDYWLFAVNKKRMSAQFKVT